MPFFLQYLANRRTTAVDFHNENSDTVTKCGWIDATVIAIRVPYARS